MPLFRVPFKHDFHLFCLYPAYIRDQKIFFLFVSLQLISQIYIYIYIYIYTFRYYPPPQVTPKAVAVSSTAVVLRGLHQSLTSVYTV